jgi:hypothetical protein
MLRVGVVVVALSACLGCATIDGVIRPTIANKAPPEATTPLALPTSTMRGAKGTADAKYPDGFTAVVNGDGSIQFPEQMKGKIQGASILVGGAAVLTVAADGTVKGAGLKGTYKFESDGDLVDANGHGVRISPSGGVRGLGGQWSHQDVFVWSVDGGGDWDEKGWHTLAIVALVMLENMLPTALATAPDPKPKSAPAASHKSDGGIYIPPPSEWFK